MQLRVRFDDPGWFVNDPRFVIKVDGAVVFDGSFRGGCLAVTDVIPGPHSIETTIEVMPGIARKKRYAIDVPADHPVEARLRYSRIWGNFARKLELAGSSDLPPARVVRE